jgi:MFS family permease
MSGIITAPAFNNLFTATKNNPTIQGVVTSIYEIGCLFGAIFILMTGDMLGRRRAIILGGIIMIVGGRNDLSSRLIFTDWRYNSSYISSNHIISSSSIYCWQSSHGRRQWYQYFDYSYLPRSVKSSV